MNFTYPTDLTKTQDSEALQLELQQKYSLPNSSRNIAEMTGKDGDGKKYHLLQWQEYRPDTNTWIGCQWDVVKKTIHTDDGLPLLYPPKLTK